MSSKKFGGFPFVKYVGKPEPPKVEVEKKPVEQAKKEKNVEQEKK